MEEAASPDGAPSPADALRQIALRLTRFEQSVDLGERSTLQLALARGVDPLLRRIDDIVAEAHAPEDSDGRITRPPFGWALHLEEEERSYLDKDYPDLRCFRVWLGHEGLRIRIKLLRWMPNPWSVTVMLDEKGGIERSGAHAIDVLRDVLNWFFSFPESAPYMAAGFETNAIVTEFLRFGQWLTREDQKQVSHDRHHRAVDITERIKPQIEHALREQGVDTDGLLITTHSTSPLWAWRPRVKIEFEFDEPRRG